MEINLTQLDEQHNLYLEQAIVDAKKKSVSKPTLVEVLNEVDSHMRSTIAQGCMLAKESLDAHIQPFDDECLVELVSLLPEDERYTFLETTSKKIKDVTLFTKVLALIAPNKRHDLALAMEIPYVIGRHGGKSDEFEALFSALPHEARVAFALECVNVMALHVDSPEHSPRELEASIYEASNGELFSNEQLSELNKLRFGDESPQLVADSDEYYEPVRKTI